MARNGLSRFFLIKMEEIMNFKNEGTFERATRIIIGLALIYWGYVVSGEYWMSYERPLYQVPCWMWKNLIGHVCIIERGFAIAAVGIIPLITGLIGWCPLNKVFKVNTYRK